MAPSASLHVTCTLRPPPPVSVFARAYSRRRPRKLTAERRPSNSQRSEKLRLRSTQPYREGSEYRDGDGSEDVKKT